MYFFCHEHNTIFDTFKIASRCLNRSKLVYVVEIIDFIIAKLPPWYQQSLMQ